MDYYRDPFPNSLLSTRERIGFLLLRDGQQNAGHMEQDLPTSSRYHKGLL